MVRASFDIRGRGKIKLANIIIYFALRKNSLLYFGANCDIIFLIAMTRKSKRMKLFRESHHRWMCCEWVEWIVPNRVSELHTEPYGVGYARIARNSDRVSTEHFLSELDKACYREKQVK